MSCRHRSIHVLIAALLALVVITAVEFLLERLHLLTERLELRFQILDVSLLLLSSHSSQLSLARQPLLKLGDVGLRMKRTDVLEAMNRQKNDRK
jgi:hypothetical protein